MAGGRPPIYETPEELNKVAVKYFEKCDKDKSRPTMSRLAYELGFESRQSFYDYEEKEEFSYTVKRLKLFIESGYEEALQGNNVAGSIFALKNMGWKDKNETELSGSVGLPLITGMELKVVS